MIPEPARRVLYFACLAIAVLILIFVVSGLSRCDADKRADDAVQLDRAETGMEAAQRVLEAERAATANATIRDEAFENAQQELRDEASKGTDDAVGGATAGVIERLRAQQSADRRPDAAR